MKTYSAKPGEIAPKWLLVDAQGIVLGRLASIVASRLRGKHKPQFTPNVDCGDYVVVVNAEKILLTANKSQKKKYYWHTGYPGGIKERTASDILSSSNPERVVLKAVQRMLPKESPLANKQFSKLRVYAGSDHPHTSQSPEILDLISMNKKNSRKT